jgi:hypothetical protein
MALWLSIMERRCNNMAPFFKQGDFTIDPNTTPEMLKAKRERLAALMPQYGKAQYIGEGLGQLFYGIGEGRQSNAMDKYEGEQRKGASDAYDTLMRGGGGPLSILGMRPQGDTGRYTPQPQTEADVLGNDVMGALGKPSQDGMGPKIVETANALGMDPVDLATIISYETAGTFDPTKAGPTTQWGQHKGLIQFGEPQAQQYGVDWANPEGSQLGADGAVAKYFKANGWQPGMGMMDAYSIVNAGGPGRYNASDANNGGAPGTVADKVNGQMAGHREKAQAMLGGTYAPQGGNGSPQPQPVRVADAGGPDLTYLMEAAANPWLTPEQRGVVNGMIQQRQAQQQAADDRYWKQQDPAYLQGLELGRIQLEQARNPQPKPTDDMREYDFAKSQGYEGTFQDFMMGMKKAGATNVNVGGEGAPGLGKLSTDYGYVLDPSTGKPTIDPITGLPRSAPIPGSPAALDAEKAAVAAKVKTGNASTASDVVTAAASRAREAAGKRDFGGFGSNIIGKINQYSDSAEVIRQVEVLKSNAKIENLTAMRAASPTGGALGAVSDKESEMLAAKSGALDPTSPNFLRDLDDYERTLLRTVHGPEAGDAIYEATRGGNATDADGWQNINGVKVRVKQ